MKNLRFLIIIFFCSVGFIFSQEKKLTELKVDSLGLKNVGTVFLDEYSSFYLYNSQDFSFIKFNADGSETGRVRFTVPFKVQSVQNPLNIFAFSRNAQEVKLFDENLVEIQKLNLRDNFASVVMAYGEDLQYMWVLEDSSKTLSKYKYREKTVERSYVVDYNFSDIRDMIVYRNQVYILGNGNFSVYDLQNNLLAKHQIEGGLKLRRENNNIYIICADKILKWTVVDGLEPLFELKDALSVGKNSRNILVNFQNKLYLYSLDVKY